MDSFLNEEPAIHPNFSFPPVLWDAAASFHSDNLEFSRSPFPDLVYTFFHLSINTSL